MKSKINQLLIGFFSALLVTIIGSELYLRVFTHFDFFLDFEFIVKAKMLGKVIAIGSICNLLLFSVFINKKLDNYANGCILAVIILTIVTLVF
ncbi:hypothetical protein ACYSNM_00890 [Myroides sp. LJL116]